MQITLNATFDIRLICFSVLSLLSDTFWHNVDSWCYGIKCCVFFCGLWNRWTVQCDSWVIRHCSSISVHCTETMLY